MIAGQQTEATARIYGPAIAVAVVILVIMITSLFSIIMLYYNYKKKLYKVTSNVAYNQRSGEEQSAEIAEDYAVPRDIGVNSVTEEMYESIKDDWELQISTTKHDKEFTNVVNVTYKSTTKLCVNVAYESCQGFQAETANEYEYI